MHKVTTTVTIIKNTRIPIILSLSQSDNLLCFSESSSLGVPIIMGFSLGSIKPTWIRLIMFLSCWSSSGWLKSPFSILLNLKNFQMFRFEIYVFNIKNELMILMIKQIGFLHFFFSHDNILAVLSKIPYSFLNRRIFSSIQLILFISFLDIRSYILIHILWAPEIFYVDRLLRTTN
ncbi:hypothetical protein BpHYR1_004960 [Brachionus plicatilis]|uniref:Uncharacterized protein n=1 Tax=Brachionus plicatilis TaxID=10195 RepID=A0A3M7RK41_BRAPC|nr:hypothetical protein BpHYR1_004960 [Brachionus plicatilis]